MTDRDEIKEILECDADAEAKCRMVSNVINGNPHCFKEPKTDILDKIRAEISEYGSLRVEYKIEGHSDRDIEKIVEDVIKQAKQQVLDTIDKYKKEGG